MIEDNMREEFLVFGAPLVEDAEIEEVVATMKSGWLGTGPKVAVFEKEFGRYKNAKHSAALSSCTAALHLSLLVAGIQPGDEVVTTPMTYCATVNAIIHAGGVPVLADVDPSTMNIDPREVERKITSRTRAILPVHLAGRSCDMDELMEIARRHNLKVIEDCAHAIETEYKGRKAGTIGDFGCFSFHATKNLAMGDGGMVIARHEEDIAQIKVLAMQGVSEDAWKRSNGDGYKHYQVIECGFKYGMIDLQAAIGIHQLHKVERHWLRRKEIWNMYDAAFRSLPLKLPLTPAPETRHACHLYTILVDPSTTGIERDAFLRPIFRTC
jgi:dTDP-4-amino-4,6-dideoxygalactose transaminase